MRCGLCILLGVVTSIAVAWGCVVVFEWRGHYAPGYGTGVSYGIFKASDIPPASRVARESAGLPFRSLHWDKPVPYRPIYPGLLANTAIYGSAWWALFFGLGILKRSRRRRGGVV